MRTGPEPARLRVPVPARRATAGPAGGGFPVVRLPDVPGRAPMRQPGGGRALVRAQPRRLRSRVCSARSTTSPSASCGATCRRRSCTPCCSRRRTRCKATTTRRSARAGEPALTCVQLRKNCVANWLMRGRAKPELAAQRLILCVAGSAEYATWRSGVVGCADASARPPLTGIAPNDNVGQTAGMAITARKTARKQTRMGADDPLAASRVRYLADIIGGAQLAAIVG